MGIDDTWYCSDFGFDISDESKIKPCIEVNPSSFLDGSFAGNYHFKHN